MKQPAHRSVVILTVILAVIAGMAAVLFISGAFNRPIVETETITPPGEVVVLKGEIICLPHKDTSGPQTQECAIGIKADNNKHYGLKNNPVTGEFNQVGKKVKVQGHLYTPNANEIYDVAGI